jgi:hypothetical protein
MGQKENTMTAPDSQPADPRSFEQKLADLQRIDPIADNERARLAGWPDRWPNNLTSTASNDDAS